MTLLPTALYTAEESRRLDAAAIAAGTPGYTLMGRAGAAAWALLREKWPEARRITVLAGAGNNGGDGYVVARLAARAGLAVELVMVGDHRRLEGEARAAQTDAIAARLHTQPWEGRLPEADVYVDALLGTGLNKAPADDFAAAITALNQSGRPVLALDIPSGLGADSGAVYGVAVQATVTISFIGLKRGLLTGAGVVCCGALHFADLDVPASVYAQVRPGTTRLDPAWLAGLLPPRRPDGHKGIYGHTLVVGGDHGMAGAVAMSAEAALRAGSGLVSVATRAQHAALITGRRPELMVHAVDDVTTLGPLLDKARVVVIGPGLGQGPWGKALLDAALASGKPLVLDADALNLLALSPLQRPDWILTPHPGEAGTLLGRSAASVQANRFAAVQALGQHFGGVPVLKGAGSLVYAGGQFRLCPYGNPGMGTAGMGDVLSGVIGGLRAQGLSAADAAAAGVLVHALAGDDAAAEGQRGLLASDLFPFIRRRVNP